MKSMILLSILCTCCIAYTNQNKWMLCFEQENTIATAVPTEHSDQYYYAIVDSGIYYGNNHTKTLLVNEENKQPEELKKTEKLLFINSDRGRRFLYASTKKKLYRFHYNYPTKSNTWSEIKAAEPTRVKKMINGPKWVGLIILSDDNKLYEEYKDSLKPLKIPESILPEYDTIIPIAIGQEKINDDDEFSPYLSTNTWALFEAKGAQRTELFIVPNFPQDSIPIRLNDTINEESAIAYGKSSWETEQILVSSYNNKIVLEVFGDPQGKRARREIYLPEGTIITDLGLFDRDFPMGAPNRLEDYSREVLFVSTSIGSYAIGIRKIISQSEPLHLTDEIDSSLCVFDTIPSSEVLFSDVYDTQLRQYIQNEKGISYFTVPYPPVAVTTKDGLTAPYIQYTTTNNTISLSLKEKQSGTLSLLNLKGQKLTAVNFVHSNKVLLSTAGNLAKGVYLLKLQTKSGVMTEKIRVE